MERKLLLPVRNEGEASQETIQYLDAHYSREIYPLKNCTLYYRGNYFVVEANDGKIADYEHCSRNGLMGYLQDAALILQRRGNTQLLKTLRQAIREDWAQGHGIISEYLCDGDGDLKVDNSLAQIKQFIAAARINDIAHHGCATF